MVRDFGFGSSKTSGGRVFQERHKDTLRQASLSRGTLCTFLKSATALFASSKSLYKFSLHTPALQTNGCPAGNIHQAKNPLPWSLPEKCWTPDAGKKQKILHPPPVRSAKGVDSQQLDKLGSTELFWARDDNRTEFYCMNLKSIFSNLCSVIYCDIILLVAPATGNRDTGWLTSILHRMEVMLYEEKFRL